MAMISDEAAVKVPEFLQSFTECFESYYYGEIHRYYQERSQASRKPGDPPPIANHPPF